MGKLPDVTPEEQSLAVDELSRVSIDFLSQTTSLWPTSSASSSRTKSGQDQGLVLTLLLTYWAPAQGQGLCCARGWGNHQCILLRPAPLPRTPFPVVKRASLLSCSQSSFWDLRGWIVLKWLCGGCFQAMCVSGPGRV